MIRSMRTTIPSPGHAAGFHLPARFKTLILGLLIASSLFGQDWPAEGVSRPKLKTAAAAPAPKLPPILYVCAANCANWRLQPNGTYIGDGNDPQHAPSVMTVEKWTPESIIVSRLDAPSFAPTGLRARYVANMNKEKTGFEGTVTFFWPNGNPPSSTEIVGTWVNVHPENHKSLPNPVYWAKIRAAEAEQAEMWRQAGAAVRFLIYALEAEASDTGSLRDRENDERWKRQAEARFYRSMGK